MFFLVNTVKDELKLPTLIAVMGDEAYELLANLASPKKPSELGYKDAVDLLRHHLQPAPSILAERYRFRQRRQNSGENVATYVAELEKLARNCKFEATLNENLRDQFVCGLRSDVIQQRLFAEDDTLVYSNAVKIASSLEAAERDAAAVEPSLGTGANGAGPSVSATVHSLASAGAHRHQAGNSRSMTSGRSRSAGRLGRAGAAGPRTASPGGGAAHGPGAGRDRCNCAGCGGTDHDYANCRFRDYVCSWCHRRGHLRRVCAGRGGNSRGGGAPSRLHYGQAQAAEDSDPDERFTEEEDFHHLCLNDYGAVSVPITIDNHVIHMEIDTGTAVSCINSETYRRYLSHCPLETSELSLRFYDGSKVKPLGVIKPRVSYGKSIKCLELFVIDGGTTSLLGRQWLTELNIRIPAFSNCHTVEREQLKMSDGINDLLCRYKELFSGELGRYNGGLATLRVREGASPVFHRARSLPYALRVRVDAELDAMLRDGIVEAVDCSDWASPLVPVNKADGSLRICADYKATLNPVLLIDRYPLPKIDDLMVNLSGASYFSKIDLSLAYNQIELDDSKKYTVINTHRGLYMYNRLVYRLSSSPGIF